MTGREGQEEGGEGEGGGGEEGRGGEGRGEKEWGVGGKKGQKCFVWHT